MRLNAINPSDNPMEALLYCFGSDGDSDSGGSDDSLGFDEGDVGGVDVGGQAQAPDASGGFGGGGDGGRDAFDASGAYVNQAITDFQASPAARQSVGVMATPMSAATVGAGYSAPAVGGGGGGGGSPVSISPVASRGPAPSLAPNLINQPITVGGAFSMPYDSFQRSPQQMFGYGGLTASPYSPSAISFAGGQAARSYDPLGGESLSVFDVGRSAQDYANRGFFDRAGEFIGGRFGAPFVEQRAGFFDPATGTFRDVGGTSTLEKVSENPLRDLFGNFVATKFGSTMNSADYMPLTGGEMYQYGETGGALGLLSSGPKMVPYSEINARVANMGGDNGGGSDQPLIIPQEVAQVDPETGEPTAFPPFTPREFEYQPYVGQFYTIPSRFTRPLSLLG